MIVFFIMILDKQNVYIENLYRLQYVRLQYEQNLDKLNRRLSKFLERLRRMVETRRANKR